MLSRTVAKLMGVIVALQMVASCALIKSDHTKQNISTVNEQLRTISDADTRLIKSPSHGNRFAALLEEKLLVLEPIPPQGVGTRYRTAWKADMSGINRNMEVEYIELVGVSDDFCKAWNNANHPEFGMVIMPPCDQVEAPYTCKVNKPSVAIEGLSPPDQCGQTCCVAGNRILYRNGLINKNDPE